MDIRLIEIAKRLSSWFGLDAMRHDGRLLPAQHLRLCGQEFRDHAYFLQSARDEANRLVTHCGLTPDSALLDVGCGFGRLAIGVLDRVGAIRSYCGVDVSAAAVAWCRRHLGSGQPSFQFTRLDVRNERYNPGGEAITGAFRLPFADAAFDIAYAYSVFSHMELGDIDRYLSELRRVVRPGGRVFVTLFVADAVPEVTINPASGVLAWQGPLHCVRYQRAFIETRIGNAGFAITQVAEGVETDGQSGYYLQRMPA
ncbi:MAG: class I SAM-dependent methyltransferase [Vicinamibacterales bacterium]